LTKKKTWSKQRDPAWSFKASMKAFDKASKKVGNQSSLKKGLDADWKAFNNLHKPKTRKRKSRKPRKSVKRKPRVPMSPRVPMLPRATLPPRFPTSPVIRKVLVRQPTIRKVKKR